MVVATAKFNLPNFLQLPNIDESPAWELLDGEAIQKPMPTLYHSTIQKRLVALIDASESPYQKMGSKAPSFAPLKDGFF